MAGNALQLAIEVKTMQDNELIKEYNELAIKHRKLKSKLSDLTERELLIYITAKTYNYGRSIQDSFENATYHMKDRKKAEKLFSTKQNDYLGL